MGDIGLIGVPGEVLAAEVRLSGLRETPGGDLRLEECELTLTLDLDVLMGCSPFGVLSLREKRPILAGVDRIVTISSVESNLAFAVFGLG